MKIISLPRGKGKTAALVKLSAATKIPILYAAPMDDLIFYQRAKELNVNIPAPVRYIHGIQGEFLVDELDHLLNYLGLRIQVATLTESKIQMTKTEVLKLAQISDDVIEII